MSYFKRLNGLALTLMTMAALSVSAFAMEYSIETEENTEYYPSTSYEVMYGAAYNYGGSNLVDYQIPELPYGVSSTTQIGIMEKGYLPGLQQNAGASISGDYGLPGGFYDVPSGSISSVKPSVLAYTSVDGTERKDGSIGTLKIPSLNINMKVWEGETRASTATSASAGITAAQNTVLAASEIWRLAIPLHIRRFTEHEPMRSFW